ncbi:helix-turn-helix domain-containing protein [Gemmiger formicilis]|nr:helix-turn-helix domain-containing protein [Gemmiger formicilis]
MFIKLYNALFDFGLKPKELKVYVYLSACQNCLGTATVRSATVQERCGMSEHTVRTAIAGLAQKGLVTVCPRRDRNGQQIAHAYKLRYLSGGWCRLPLDALSLPARDFAVYAYLCRCANRLRKAFPSFTHMANALRVAVTTVQTAIKNLAAAGLLLKAAFRAGKHNLYILVDAKRGRLRANTDSRA